MKELSGEKVERLMTEVVDGQEEEEDRRREENEDMEQKGEGANYLLGSTTSIAAIPRESCSPSSCTAKYLFC